MSRAYRVSVRESLRKVLRAEDRVQSQLELLEILPADQMAGLLAAELAGRGFERKSGAMVRTDGDIEIHVDPATGTVTVRAAASQSVDLKGEKQGYGYDDVGPGRKAAEKQLSEQLRASLEAQAEQQNRKLQQEVTDLLERRLGDVAAELDQAVNRATAEALKRKAAQMGRIKQMADDPESGSLTIVVEL